MNAIEHIILEHEEAQYIEKFRGRNRSLTTTNAYKLKKEREVKARERDKLVQEKKAKHQANYTFDRLKNIQRVKRALGYDNSTNQIGDTND